MIVINGIVYLHIPQKNNNKIHLILFIEIIVKSEKIENLLHSILKDFFVNICCIKIFKSFCLITFETITYSCACDKISF